MINETFSIKKLAHIIKPNSTIIVGFSGGPDSVYLLLALRNMQSSHNLKIIAAHLDHEWRKESAQEAIWCEQFCHTYTIEFMTQKASLITVDKNYNGSKEEYARVTRRIFFETIAQQYQSSYIALAHHKDDQIETFFIRLARGTSLTGLTGIKEDDGRYIRPLLETTKQEIINTLTKNNIDFLKDPSNNDTNFLRNRIRHTLIPTLSQVDTRLQNNIFNTMKHLQQVDTYLQQVTDTTITSLAHHTNLLSLNTASFLQLDTIIQQRVLLRLLIKAKARFTPSQKLFSEIIRFLKSSKNKEHIIHPTYKISKHKKFFSIEQR
ncbi:MAG: tRNA lysidine(34) synthetase TilS [Epsilonproteobacteria bacterium]|nr:tRNA lysidine(34) synthetase TilS [Campylobacterota bacterium]|tara:strand:+ start:1435 stop:2397 length:963 start_codon:yes stop_codon:yes gene_type:complete